jgi:putative PIN family toxin of toxin-antitoxin system
MIRAVLDTNVVVSGLMRPLGIPARILSLAYARRIEVCISAELFSEYQEVLRRPRLQIPDVATQQLLDWCKDHTEWVDARPVLSACSDPDDNMVLACAQESAADFLVTGNVIDFPRQWRKTRIVTPREFVDALEVLDG